MTNTSLKVRYAWIVVKISEIIGNHSVSHIIVMCPVLLKHLETSVHYQKPKLYTTQANKINVCTECNTDNGENISQLNFCDKIKFYLTFSKVY